MSTLRTDTLQTTDSLVTIQVADLTGQVDLGNDTDPTKGAALVGYKGRTVAERLSDVTSVKDFGAVGDGVTDDQAAFAAALASSYSVYVPPGRYLIGSGNLLLQENRLWSEAGTSGGTWAARGTTGTVLITTQTVNPVINLRNGGVIEGIQFYYPNQDGSGITDISGYPTIVGAPIVYPPSISANSGAANWEISNCTFLNSYECISIGDPTLVAGSGRGLIRGCSAFVIKHFFRGYNLLDQVIIDDYTLSPGVIAGDDLAKQKLNRWALRNSAAFQINKSDGLQIGTGIVYGVDICFNFIGALAHSLLKIRGLTLDGSRRFIDSTVTLSGAVIGDCQLFCNTVESATETYAPAIRLGGPNAPAFGGIQMDNIQCDQCLGEVIKIEGTGTTVTGLTLTNFHFMGWGAGIGAGANCAAIAINSVGSVANISDGWLSTSNVNYVGIVTSGAGAEKLSISNVRQDGGLQFAALSNINLASIDQCVTSNTAPGTPDISLTNVAAFYDSRNVFAVYPVTKRSNSPAFIAFQSGAQVVAPGATVQFATETLDNDSSFNPATGIFTCKKPGTYLFDTGVTQSAGAAGDVWVLQLVTTQASYESTMITTTATENKTVSVSGLARMRVGDTARVILQRPSGTASFTTDSSGSSVYFTGVLIDF